jgi:KTSC domain-containing protein
MATDRVPLESTTLAWVSYSPDQDLLELGFQTGTIYDYFDVPPRIYRELLASDSKGRYFNQHIRNAFRSQQVHHRSAS